MSSRNDDSSRKVKSTLYQIGIRCLAATVPMMQGIGDHYIRLELDV